jgi:hypothetical protein
MAGITVASLKQFDRDFDTGREDRAAEVRGDFLKAFPKSRIPNLAVDDYVIGHQTPTFCAYVEAKTHDWANIKGATAEKFGIYYGKTSEDETKKYRFTKRFGSDKRGAFEAVRIALASLINLGAARKLDFDAIDSNPLSQMFKAKILSLYFPDKFLNVCSGESLFALAKRLRLEHSDSPSQLQHLLLKEKLDRPLTRSWSNPKFTSFLFESFLNTPRDGAAVNAPSRNHRRVEDWDEIQANKDRFGKLAEEFAIEWERSRLRGAEMAKMVEKIEDMRDRPGFGFDYLSYSSPRQRRYIEVKSVAKRGGDHRFFLSANELVVSKSAERCAHYFFYLVEFDGKGRPCDLRAVRAKDVYNVCQMIPASYEVRVGLTKLRKR